MELITLYNIQYLNYIKLISACIDLGKKVPEELIDSARHCGRLAEVPEEMLNFLEMVNHHGATIH